MFVSAAARASRLSSALSHRALRRCASSSSSSSSSSSTAAPLPGDHMLERMGLPPSSRRLQLAGRFELGSGAALEAPHVAFNTYGTLNAAADNCVLVGHSLTSNSCVHEWWGELVGEGAHFALDTSRFFVVCANFLGSPYGSAGPLDVADAATGRRAAADFPVASVRDNARLQRALLERLGVRRLAYAVGGSLGGCLALEFAASFPELVDGLVLVATCARHTDWAIGLGEAGRQAIFADPLWRDGYYLNGGVGAAHPAAAGAAVAPSPPPLAGMSAARQFAMLSYRSPQSLTEKFGRAQHAAGRGAAEARRQGGGASRAGVAPVPFFEVERYLNHQGAKLTRRFDPLCYVRLTQLLDSHDVGAGRGDGSVAPVLRALAQRTLVVGIDSDLLYPLPLSREMAELIPRAELRVISSPHGHDSFLIHIDELNRIVSDFVRRG
jgi:homoserine O-acetyltransferase